MLIPNNTIPVPALNKWAVEYQEEEALKRFMGLRLAPTYVTPIQAAKFGVYSMSNVLKIAKKDIKLTPGQAYPRADAEFDEKEFACEKYGWEEPINDDNVKLYKTMIDVDRAGARRALFIPLLVQEKRIADQYFNETTFASYKYDVNSSSTAWSDTANADPRKDIQLAQRTVRARTGERPQDLFVSATVFETYLMLNAKFLSHVQYTNAVLTSTYESQILVMAAYLGVQRLHVGDAVYDSADAGQSATITDVWDTDLALLAKVAQGSGTDIAELVVGRTVMWEGGADDKNVIVSKWRDERVESWIYRVKQWTDDMTVSLPHGQLLYDLKA